MRTAEQATLYFWVWTAEQVPLYGRGTTMRIGHDTALRIVYREFFGAI